MKVGASEFPHIRGIKVHIPIDPDVKPVVQSERRVPIALEDAATKELDKLEGRGIIKKVTGFAPWQSSMVLVPKKEGVRICVDLRAVNKAVLKETHPLPTLDWMAAQMHGAKIFSTLDIELAFHQIMLDEASQIITTFKTHLGLYRYCRLVLGLSSAAEIFQRTIETLLQELKGIIVYIDDIIVFGRTQEEHDRRLKALLQRLNEYGVKLNANKCNISKPSVEFIGHVVSEKGIKPKEDKVDKIMNWRNPKDKSEVRSLLGLIQYTGARHIPHLSTLTEPLRRLTLADTKFEWNREQQDAFDAIKLELNKMEENKFYSAMDRTVVYADASPVALGAVLIQVDTQNSPRIICHASKSLSEYERKLSQTEKEAIALVWALERFHIYVFGREVELMTDHKALEVIFGVRHRPSPRLERLQIRLQNYNVKVKYIAGKLMIADIFSRLCDTSQPEPIAEMESSLIAALVPDVDLAINVEQLRNESNVDKTIVKVREALQTNKWEAELAEFKKRKEQLSFVNDILVWERRIVIPTALRKRVLKIAHRGHPGMNKMKAKLRQRYWYPGLDKDVEAYVSSCIDCKMVEPENPPLPMTCTILPDGAWDYIAIDLFEPLPDGQHLLVVIDYFSRFFEVKIMKQIRSSDIIRALEEIFARYGKPIKLKSDNGPQFQSEEFKAYCKAKGIELIFSPPYYPRVNGEVERQMRSLKKVLTIAFNTGQDWQRALTDYLVMYRTTPHPSTGETPASLVLKKQPRDDLPALEKAPDERSEIRERDAVKKAKAKEYGDRHKRARQSGIKDGDKV